MGNSVEAMPAMKKNLECNSEGDIFNKMVLDLEFENSETAIEFQLPEWVKKGKTIPYTFIKRNVYCTKKAKRRIEDDGIFCSCSPSPGSLSVCGRDCHCGMLLSSCSTTCKCGDSCLNKPFQHRTVKKMKLVKTEKCGSGLVADEDIKEGEFVIEYVGEVIDDKTCEERLWQMKASGETNFYLCEINRDMVIDATYKGNKSRFINHSCAPNTEMQKWRIEGETRIGIFATRNIKRGEDLTYDYQFVQFGADQDCHCGALGCRQKLGIKPRKPKMSSSRAALELVAREVAASSPKVKALLSGNNVQKDLLDGGLDRGNDAVFCRVFLDGSDPCKKAKLSGEGGDFEDTGFLFHYPLQLLTMCCIGSLRFGSSFQRKICFQNCIGEFVQIRCPHEDRWYPGYISHFNRNSRKHTITFMERNKAIIDMSKATWEFL